MGKNNYFDSNNYNHACLFISFTVSTDYQNMGKLVKAYKRQRGDDFSIQDDLELRRSFSLLTDAERHLMNHLAEREAELFEIKKWNKGIIGKPIDYRQPRSVG